MYTAIAIDGPAGAGKSTIARRLSERLGYIYVDTGALYRAVALFLLRENIDISDASAVESALSRINIDIAFENGVQQVILCGENVSGLIRTPEVSMMASGSSALPCVRAFLLEQQRELAKTHNVIMDGRDIGTVVLPNANIKIFLTASAECRAKRRYDELLTKGEQVTFDEVLADMEKRDYQDSHRAVAPLRPAGDSVTVDTSDLGLAEAVDKMEKLVRSRL